MIEILDRSKSRPLPCGLVTTLRSLEIGESIIIPESKKSSVHPAAKRAGIRVTLRTLDDGTVCAWRVPLTTPKQKPAAQTPAPTVAPEPASGSSAAPSPAAPVAKPRAATHRQAQGGHYIEPTYGPSIFVADEDFFGEPIPPAKADILS